MDLLEDGGDSSSSAPSTPRAAVEAADDRLLVAVEEQQSPPSFSGQMFGRRHVLERLASAPPGNCPVRQHRSESTPMGYLAGAELGHTGGGCGLSHGDSAAERCATRASVQRPASRWLPCSQPRPLPSVSQLSSSSSSSSGAGSGVLLAVRAGYSADWSDVSRHASGRAVAAVLHTQNGLSFRVAAIYGPVGACLPDLVSATPPLFTMNKPLKSFWTPKLGRPLNINSYSSSGVTSTLSCPKSLIVGRAHTPSVQPPWHLSFRHVASWTCSAPGTLDLKHSPFSPGQVQQAGLTPDGGRHAHPWRFIFSTPRFYGSGTAGSPVATKISSSGPNPLSRAVNLGLGQLKQ